MRLLVATLLVAATLVGARSAQAQPAAPETHTLVLPTAIGGWIPNRSDWQREFDARMLTALRQFERTRVQAPGLTTEDLACRDATCAKALAQRFEVDEVTGSRVVADLATPPSYHLTVWRYLRAVDQPARE